MCRPLQKMVILVHTCRTWCCGSPSFVWRGGLYLIREWMMVATAVLVLVLVRVMAVMRLGLGLGVRVTLTLTDNLMLFRTENKFATN